MSDERAWAEVGPVDSVPVGKATKVTVGGVDLLLYRTADRLFAVGDRCTHMSAPLHDGAVKATGSLATVTCPLHGSMFGLADGRVLRGPAAARLPAYEARVSEGLIEVRPLA